MIRRGLPYNEANLGLITSTTQGGPSPSRVVPESGTRSTSRLAPKQNKQKALGLNFQTTLDHHFTLEY